MICINKVKFAVCVKKYTVRAVNCRNGLMEG